MENMTTKSILSKQGKDLTLKIYAIADLMREDDIIVLESELDELYTDLDNIRPFLTDEQVGAMQYAITCIDYRIKPVAVTTER